MKIGETFHMSLPMFAEPMLGKLVDVQLEGETVRARVMSMDATHVKLAVVPNTTKE